MYIPKDVKFIIKKLNNKGYEAFVVGGCVRDSIMKKKPKDWDITTSATPKEIKSIFFKTIDTGIEHGTVTVILNKKAYELTTYRIDGKYKDYRRPDTITFTNKLEEDLKRRDFTINAIAYNSKIGFIDPYKGIEDIKSSCIRGVGDSSLRFKEDALRMLRAIRFSCQLGFFLESSTFKAIKNNNYLIEKISVERIREELIKMILSKHLNNLDILIKSNILNYINEDLNIYLNKYMYNNIKYINKCDFDYIERFSLLFKDINKETLLKILKYLKFSNKDTKYIINLVKYINIKIEKNKYEIKKLLSKIDEEIFFKILKLKSILGEDIFYIKKLGKYILDNKEPLKITDLNLNGNIIKEKVKCKNNEIGKLLDYALDNVLKDFTLNEEDKLIYLINNYLDKINNQKI